MTRVAPSGVKGRSLAAAEARGSPPGEAFALRPSLRWSGHDDDNARNTAQVRDVRPNTNGCEECLQSGDAWVHLGCVWCAGMPHAPTSRRIPTPSGISVKPVIRRMQSAQPGEEWCWYYINYCVMELPAALALAGAAGDGGIEHFPQHDHGPERLRGLECGPDMPCRQRHLCRLRRLVLPDNLAHTPGDPFFSCRLQGGVDLYLPAYVARARAFTGRGPDTPGFVQRGRADGCSAGLLFE